MKSFNSVSKIDCNGEIYSRVIFDCQVIKIGLKGQIGANKGKAGIGNEEENRKRSVRRSKTSVRDYVETNAELRYFVTYTLDSRKIDRYDEKGIYNKMRNWLADNVKRKGFEYILVPERHKDGAWHFHGFVNKPLKWKYGFCRIEELNGVARTKAIGYMVSYVKKNMEKFNGRRYLHSRGLRKPEKVYVNVDFEKEEGKIIELKETGLRVKLQGRIVTHPSLPPSPFSNPPLGAPTPKKVAVSSQLRGRRSSAGVLKAPIPPASGAASVSVKPFASAPWRFSQVQEIP